MRDIPAASAPPAGPTSRGRIARVLGLWALLGAAACTTTPPPVGLTLVETPSEPVEPEEVARAQTILRDLEIYLGPIDGALDAETRVALARFQRRAGLEVSGNLDPPTREALQAGAPEAPPEDLRPLAPPLPALPSAEALLAPDPPRPQPPPGWLAPRIQPMREQMGEAARRAARILEEGGGDGAGEAAGLLRRARAEAFDAIVALRMEGGFAPLPPALLASLREALQERDLLVRPAQGGWGRGEEEAVRWLERSMGLPLTGLPSLALLEALGLDPEAVFSAGDGSEGQTAVQSGP